MNKFKKFMSLAMLATMVVNVPVTAYAAPTSQSTQVKYRTLSRAEKNLLRTFFDAEYYAKLYPGVVEVFGNNPDRLFDHFVRYGVFEGRASSAEFDASVYKACYSDLDEAFGDDMFSYYAHYALFGKNENREYVTVEKAAEAGISIGGSSTASESAPSQAPASSPAQTVTIMYVHEATVIKNEPNESAPAVANLSRGDVVRIVNYAADRNNHVTGDYFDGVQYLRLEDGRYVRNERYIPWLHGIHTSDSLEEFPYGKCMVSETRQLFDTPEGAFEAVSGVSWSTVLSTWTLVHCGGGDHYVNPANNDEVEIAYGQSCPDNYYNNDFYYEFRRHIDK